jgi:hypothetical protein
MLKINSYPPSFQIEDSFGENFELDQFLGSRRILLIFNPTEDYIIELLSKNTDLLERDLEVV